MSNPGNKNICFFNTNKSYGGGEKWHLETAIHLSSENKIFFYAHKDAVFLERINPNQINLSTTNLSNLSFLNPIKILNLAKQFKNKKIDTIIINLPSDLKVAGFAAKIAGIQNIIYRRGSAIIVKNSLLNRYIFNNIITKILVNSEETRNTISTNFPSLIHEDKIKVIYNGIDLSEYDKQSFRTIINTEDENVVIGNAGRLVKQKNHEDLLHIASILKNREISFIMLIAGEGELKEDLERISEELGVTDYVRFIGHIDNIKSFMESIDIFALTSHWEGFGYVLAEAMASSKPVVAFNTSSNPELIFDNKNGFLAKRDDINDFANKLEILISDKDKRKELGCEGRIIVKEKFSFQKNIKTLERFLVS